MKNLIIVCAIAYTTNLFAQNSNENKLLKDLVKEEYYTFVPSKELLNSEIWTRVSNTRFECNFLRLAVEYQDFEYVLYEMDEPKRELSRAPEYHIIRNEITLNTLRSSPNFIKTNNTVSVDD